jgi:FKBP-type peptidyl-prolyl cis-trans isomerase
MPDFPRPLVVAALLLTACAKLTEPPKPEPAEPEQKQAPTAKPADQKPQEQQPQPAASAPPAAPTNEKLEIKDLQVGKGAEAKTGDTVSVHYVGTLPDGKEFDQSKKRGKPFDFQLGAGQVIKGWDEGVKGMKVGGKRKLVIPPGMGYGARGVPGAIPPNSNLIFEVELLEVKAAAKK